LFVLLIPVKLSARQHAEELGKLITANPPALQLYTVREQIAAGRKGLFERIANFGYGAVEPFDVITAPDRLRDDLQAAGLAVCSVHGTPYGKRTAAVLRGASTLGADTVIVPRAPAAMFSSHEAIEALARRLNDMAATAADAGLRLGYHNHDFELASTVGGRTALEVLADALGDGVLLEIDIYWAAVAGQDVPSLLRRLGDRVRYLHIKDGPVARDEPMTAVGVGRIPVAEILAASPSAEWHVVELDRCATDILEAAGASLAWLAARGLAQPVQPVPSVRNA
jgi:sugar phosphate isomerase/epimerase